MNSLFIEEGSGLLIPRGMMRGSSYYLYLGVSARLKDE